MNCRFPQIYLIKQATEALFDWSITRKQIQYLNCRYFLSEYSLIAVFQTRFKEAQTFRARSMATLSTALVSASRSAFELRTHILLTYILCGFHVAPCKLEGPQDGCLRDNWRGRCAQTLAIPALRRTPKLRRSQLAQPNFSKTNYNNSSMNLHGCDHSSTLESVDMDRVRARCLALRWRHVATQNNVTCNDKSTT